VRSWIPIALIAVAVLAIILFYSLGSMEQQGSSSIGLINIIGVMTVIVGVLAAGLVLRRASPPQ
jgi:hypothetical protein